MGAKADKRRRDRARRKANTASQPPGAMRHVDALTAGWHRLADYVGGSDTAEQASQAAGRDEALWPPQILAHAVDAWNAGSLISLFGLNAQDTVARLDYASRLRETSMRNPVYPHMLLDTYRGLFSSPEVETDIRGSICGRWVACS